MHIALGRILTAGQMIDGQKEPEGATVGGKDPQFDCEKRVGLLVTSC